jgi:hypothetical protein
VPYPYSFRPNAVAQLYDAAGVAVGVNFQVQILKPLLATSLNTYTSGGKTIFSPGALILRIIAKDQALPADVPGASNNSIVFVPDPLNWHWRIASCFPWWTTTVSGLPRYHQANLGLYF